MKAFESRKGGVGQSNALRRLLGLTLIIVTCAIAAALWAALQRKNRIRPPHGNLPTDLARRQSVITYTRSGQQGRLFTIHAARTLAYSQESGTVLEGVDVVMFGKAGNRRDTIRTQRCRYNEETGAMACSGEASIVLESSAQAAHAKTPSGKPPVLLYTSDISYNPHDSTVTTSQPVRFQYGLISGAAIGLTYNTQQGQIELRKSVAAEMPLREQGQSVARVTAGSLSYSKQASQIILRSPVSVSNGAGQVQAPLGIIDLDAQGRTTKVVLTGGVRGTSFLTAGTFRGTAADLTAAVDPATSRVRNLLASGAVNLDVEQKAGGGDRRLSAQTAQISFGGAQGKAQAGSALGEVRISYSPAAGSGGSSSVKPVGLLAGSQTRVLTAARVDFTFQVGQTLKEVHTVGPGKILSLPVRSGGDREIATAGQFRASFDSLGRMVRLLGVFGTKIVDQPGSADPPGSVPKESSAQETNVALDPSTGAAEALTQTGDFHFRQGSLCARADESHYQPATQQLTLYGHPVVWDAKGRVRAKHMELNLGSGIATGWGNVEAVEFQLPGQSANPTLSGGQPAAPLIVLADRLLDNRNTQWVRFEGNVRAWDGPDSVQSPSLDVYQALRRVSSGSGVVTSFVSPPSSAGADASGNKPRVSQARADQPTIIHADHLLYFDIGQRAVYRGHVQMESADGTLRSNGLDVYFSEPPGGGPAVLSRAIAMGNVTMTQPGRRATGQRADYFAAAGKVVLTGGPPAVYDQTQGFLTAPRLTFYLHDASLFADGGSKAPALSKRHVQRQ